MNRWNKTQNSLRNVGVAIAAYFAITFFAFLDRTIFIRLLSADYLGLNGLFSNILSMLSLAELGVGSAIAYSLYAPLDSGNISMVQAIMRLYKKLYCIIGSIVLLLGAALTPFLPWLIKDIPTDMPDIYTYYLLYVLNVGSSYFFTYKRTLIICDQKQYISTVTSTLSSILTSLLRMGILLLVHNYLFYLIVGIVATIGENIVISVMADRMYPYLRTKEIQSLPKETTICIRKNIYAMFCHKIGNVVVNCTDNLIISRFVGLAAVGLYSNYTLILSKVSGLLGKFFSSVTASVGMLALDKDKNHVEQVLYRMLFLNFWMYAFSCIGFFCLVQPFIRLWIGSEYQLSIWVVLVAVLNFYLTGMRQTVLTFRDAAGVFWYDRYKALIESAVNVVLSIPLAMKFGISGVLLGTIGSTLLVPFWYDGYILFRHLFHKGIGKYLRRQLFYGTLALAAGCITWYLCRQVSGGKIEAFLLQIVICIIVPNIMFFLVLCKSREWSYYRELFQDLWNKGKMKIKCKLFRDYRN